MKNLKENKAFIIFYKVYTAIYLVLCAAYLLSLVVNWDVRSEYSSSFLIITAGFLGLSQTMKDDKSSKSLKFFHKKSVTFSLIALSFILGFLGYFLGK